MKKFKVVCFTLLAASAIASTFYFTTAKAANSKNPDTIIETEEASTEEQPSILPQNDRPSKVGSCYIFFHILLIKFYTIF